MMSSLNLNVALVWKTNKKVYSIKQIKQWQRDKVTWMMKAMSKLCSV